MLKQLLRANSERFHPVVPFDPKQDRLISVDLGAGNKQLTKEVTGDIGQFSNYFEELLGSNGALYAIGGYAEHRMVYANSNVFDATEKGLPRRFHIGVDIWGKALTPVHAVMEGRVHSFANNNRVGDYGATIILSHELRNSSFHSLYGHLSLDSLEGLYEGKAIAGCERIASLGTPKENGNWPPHLHFQIIENIGDWRGDYPGVCAIEEKDRWLANSPDPDLILQLNRFIV